ncbi:hypothetical protein A2257_00205 [Candidatus Falkowbacteria bacterium RIFOXYA2_FULL_38_12]|uniref:Uncharacterized protein n=1 Tax=Candidatus Falkowbacteria bacterium RIFOXYA2_FULL_38_12 TaxID=1797993 RepID=A0A1F5S3N9_9BACT|nr:MAG: hypothetical protein A2257_00205 [Candidatus Falkowbacteria bacterium RIFOXYA2_FULL_38_12]
MRSSISRPCPSTQACTCAAGQTSALATTTGAAGGGGAEGCASTTEVVRSATAKNIPVTRI